jgi:hypothetical protein
VSLAVALAATPRPWQQEWNRYLHSYAKEERVAAIVADPRDLYVEEWRVLLIDAGSPWLTAEFVADVHDHGRGVIAVVGPTDRRRKDRAMAAGVDLPLEADATSAEMLAALHAVGRQWPGGQRTARPRVTRQPNRAGGQIIAVGGPAVARPERVALGLATVLGHHERVVVIDANDVEPSCAQRLDLHPQPNIATAAARSLSEPVMDLQSVPGPGGGFSVLPGLADPAQWSTVSAGGARRAVDALAGVHDRVIVVVGPLVEDLPRFGLTLAMLAHAEAVVAVGEASPTGIASWTTWVAGAARVAPAAAFYPAAICGDLSPSQRAEVAELLDKVGRLVPGHGTVTLLPAPDRSEERARWNGRLARQRAFTRELNHLAREVTS